MKTDNYLSGTHVTDLLLHRVLPEWLIALARGKEYCELSNSEKFIRNDHKGTRIARRLLLCFWVTALSIPPVIFYLAGGTKDVWWILSPKTIVPYVFAVILMAKIISLVLGAVLSVQSWVAKLQKLEKHVCCYQSFQASLGKANGPLGIFMFIGVEEDTFRRACDKLLHDLALQVVTRERCIPESHLLIDDDRKRFTRVIDVLKELGVSDGDYRPHYNRANETFAQMQLAGCFEEPVKHLDLLPVRLPELKLATA